MYSRLLVSAATWTGLGLASGLGYRELTRQVRFTGFTQLALAHTHALALGTLVLLLVLLLVRAFAVPHDRRLRLFLLSYNAGLALTFTMLVVKGTLQVLGHPLATSPMIAGVSGLGHMTLAASLALLFVILFRAVRTTESSLVTAPSGDSVPA